MLFFKVEFQYDFGVVPFVNPQEIQEKSGFPSTVTTDPRFAYTTKPFFPIWVRIWSEKLARKKTGEFLQLVVDLIRCSNEKVTGKEWDI